MVFQERYTPIPMAADSTFTMNSVNAIGGFIAVTAGTITVARQNQSGGYTTILNAFPVSAGAVYGLPMYVSAHGGTVTLAGGASGTLLTS